MKPFLLSITFLVNLLLSAQELIQFDQIMAKRPISQYTIREWNMDNGLPNNAIMDVVQTSDGYLWLATFNGLVRFDGLEFSVFNGSTTTEFTTNSISALVVDDKDQLWIGTNGGGLLKYQAGSFTRFDLDSIRGSIITSMVQGTNGEIWIGTRYGLIAYKNGSFARVDDPILQQINITSLDYDDRQRLWIGTTTQGLYVIDTNGSTNISTQHGLPSNWVYAVFLDSKGNTWVGTDRGLAMVDENGVHTFESFEVSPKTYTNDFLEDKAGNIWMASKEGLFRFNESFEKVDENFEVGHHVVQSLFQDREENLWAGTFRVGLSRINQSKFILLGGMEGLPNEVINVTYLDGDKYWIGTDAGLICMKDGQIHIFKIDNYSAGNRIRDIYRDSRGRLWLCTYNGLVQFEDGEVVRKYTKGDGLSSNSARRIVEDQQGNLWIGTANGLNRMRDDTIEIFSAASGLRDNFIMSLFVDASGTLWVGTNGGGSYNLKGDRFQRVLSPRASNDIVFNFTQDQDLAIWVSTNRGVTYVADSVEFDLSIKHGLISNNVFQVILENQEVLWFASDRGVMRVGKEQIEALINGDTTIITDTRIFDRSDGLRTGQITPASISSLSKAGEIWFSTLKGVAILNSRNIPTNELRANVLVTHVITDLGEAGTSKEIILPPGNRRLDFYYTGISFSAPEKIRFRYQLENFDQYWIDAGNRRTAYYTNLPPGVYDFKVMAANNDGLWSEMPATFQLVQEAYFYQEDWFYMALGAFLIALGAFLYYLRARGLNRRNYQLARLVQERTKDIQYQNEEIVFQKEELRQLNTVKDKLLSVISHDLRGPIAAVSGLLGLLKSGHLNYHELIGQSNKLYNEVQNLTYLLDNLLSWSKTQMQGIKLNCESFPLRDVVEQNLKTVNHISEQKKISVFNKIPKDCMVYTDVNFLSLVVRNLVINALKFTHEKGEISISSKTIGDQVQVSVTDTGVGMSEDELKKLFNTESHYSKMGTANEAGTGIGLLLCKEFIELEGGKIWAESKQGEGSSFNFLLKRKQTEPVQLA